MLLRFVAILLSLALPATRSAAAEAIDAQLRDAGTGFVGYVHSADLAESAFERWPGATARTLSADARTGRLSVQVALPAGWRLGRVPVVAESIELIVLDGAVQFGRDSLQRWDFAFVPPSSRMPRLASRGGATLLVFFDPPAPDVAAVARQRERGTYVTRFDPARWVPASLAKSAGATADLRVMHLKKDPFTTARTWFVKLDGGMKVPWEVHSMVEEGYVMAGEYRLAECLPSRTVVGDYRTGGYFWRPGGIPHSGPDSGPISNTVWLQRSPIALDVVFYGRCADGAAAEPVTAGGSPTARRPTTRVPSTTALLGNSITASPSSSPADTTR
jgi:hypothetical protein